MTMNPASALAEPGRPDKGSGIHQRLGAASYGIVVRADSPHKSLQDLDRRGQGQARPGELRIHRQRQRAPTWCDGGAGLLTGVQWLHRAFTRAAWRPTTPCWAASSRSGRIRPVSPLVDSGRFLACRHLRREAAQAMARGPHGARAGHSTGASVADRRAAPRAWIRSHRSHTSTPSAKPRSSLSSRRCSISSALVPMYMDHAAYSRFHARGLCARG